MLCQVTVRAADGDASHPAPKVLMSSPAGGSSVDLNGTYGGKVEFYFSEEIKKKTGSIAVKKCPATGPCSDGQRLERSRLQLLLKLAGTVTAAFTFWLFKFGCTTGSTQYVCFRYFVVHFRL